MPLAYEYDLDNHAILVSGWDHVTIGDALEYFEELAAMPTDLAGCVEYCDFSEVSDIHVCEKGAMQLAAAYERVLDRGVLGVVLHVTSDNIRTIAEAMIFTFSEVCGGFREGYRIARRPVPPEQLHAFLRADSGKNQVIEVPKVA